MTSLVETADKFSIEDYFQKCLENMYYLIRVNKLTEQFLNIDINSATFIKTGFMFNNEPVIKKIENLTDSDGHSGASFGCCCLNVYHRLMTERKQQRRARFRGLIKAIVKLKKLRLKAAQCIYSPGGSGFLLVQQEFNQLQK